MDPKQKEYEEKVAAEKAKSGIGNGAEQDEKIRKGASLDGTNKAQEDVAKVAAGQATNNTDLYKDVDADNLSSDNQNKIIEHYQKENELLKNQINDSVTEDDYKAGYDRVKGMNVDHVEDSTYKNKAENSVNDVAKEVSNATDEELLGYMQDIQNDITSSDITTEQGRANVESYLKQMDQIVRDSDAFKRWTKDYKNAQALSALSAGIGAAFGVPAIDFTNKPSIQQAKAVVNEAYAYLNDVKKQMQTRQQEYRDTTKQKALEKISARKNAAQQIADANMNMYTSDQTARNLTNANLDSMKAEDLYLLGRGQKATRALSEADADRSEYRTWAQAGRKTAQDLTGQVASTVAGLAGKVGSDEKIKSFVTKDKSTLLKRGIFDK